MVHQLILLSSFFLLIAAYSPKSQFDKSNHTQTLQQEQEVDPRTVIGGAMGGAVQEKEIQREEEDSSEHFNCEEARRVCGPDFIENNSSEL